MSTQSTQWLKSWFRFGSIGFYFIRPFYGLFGNILLDTDWRIFWSDRKLTSINSWQRFLENLLNSTWICKKKSKQLSESVVLSLKPKQHYNVIHSFRNVSTFKMKNQGGKFHWKYITIWSERSFFMAAFTLRIKSSFFSSNTV